ncbi:hypothetical protein JB92DRAFT_2835297 [Gautieria morchelliformis]|nr:hypothetical protein JB92DRAFT_2835297 [Gautieria morchelliformis]
MPSTDYYGTDAPSGTPYSSDYGSNASLSSDVSNVPHPRPPAQLTMEQQIEKKRQEAEEAALATASDNVPIDPALTGNATQTSGTLGSKRAYQDFDIDDSIEASVACRGRAQQLVATLKSRKKYKPATAALLDSWAESQNDPLSRELIILDAVLSTLPDENLGQAQYQISRGLKMNIKKYTQSIILSPMLTAYKGNIASAVLNVMRELNICKLPAAAHEDQIQVVITEISAEATTIRNIIKKQIIESLPEQAKLHHISDLCHTILKKSGTGLGMTTYTQVRMAFLRTVVREHLDARDTWDLVDKTLRDWE